MKRHVGMTVALMVGICGNAMAGQYKTLNTGGLAAGASMCMYSSPKNALPTPKGMEMEVYEWQTSSAGGFYRCSLTSNQTGKTLNLRMIGLDGTIISSTSCAAGTSCATPTSSLTSYGKFACVVATNSFTAFTSDAVYYRLCVDRRTSTTTLQAQDTALMKPNNAGVIVSE
ncbi:hypothetical protein VU07_02900 [Desulfobulbus sp. F4]|nr:hypothetical protein [Desulfobulbus sp. F4]